MSENFSVFVKEVCLQLGINQGELILALGVSFETVNRWENGKTTAFPLDCNQFDIFCDEMIKREKLNQVGIYIMGKNTGTNLCFEDELWMAVDKPCGTMDSAEYKHVVLGLIFLKYISDSFFEKYEVLQTVEGSFNKVTQNSHQSQVLTNIRETLLPKLLLGEIRIPEAENLAEEVL